MPRRRPSTQTAFLNSFGSGAKRKWGTPKAREQAIWHIVSDSSNARRPLTQLEIARRHGVNRKFVQAVERFFVPVPGREVRRRRIASMVAEGTSYQAAGKATGLSTQQAKRIATARGRQSRFVATHGRRLSPEERARLRAELDSRRVTVAARNAGVTLSTAQRERNKLLRELYKSKKFEGWLHLKWRIRVEPTLFPSEAMWEYYGKLPKEGQRVLKEVAILQSLYEIYYLKYARITRKRLLDRLLDREGDFVEYLNTEHRPIPGWFNQQVERHVQAWHNLIKGS